MHEKTFRFPKRGVVCLAAGVLLAGCASQPYMQGDSTGQQVADNAVRYGSMAAAGTGGYFAGKAIGGSSTAGAVGAGVGVLGQWAVNKFYDRKRKDAFAQGVADGKAELTAQILNEKWKKEAEYALPPEGKRVGYPNYRTAYIPSRKDPTTGVTYPGEYQTVPVYR
ncbi:hypothetical protein MAMC_00615 [Methylacidimicrobium cyclopophantes]|uniref:Glycine zipper domain-containing protein n=1 Tax=Methylacidimicrobium cyclopophantes TaxID=1041766 RepID=A0A5E6M801_9BACT|nr:hypothetical protein [Methylacidimicrobium cyclopophantes]VVM05483.1 hypothetical protein MAMC_00615 [Methylacidimicrobium cyclopophantes]